MHCYNQKMTVTIKIPNVTERAGEGTLLSLLIDVVSKSESASGEVIWDFSGVSILHPFFLASLSIYKNSTSKFIDCINMSLHVQSLMNKLFFDPMLHFENDQQDVMSEVLSEYEQKSYIPLCSFAMSEANKDALGSVIQRIIVQQTQIPLQGITCVNYFISELLDNIFEHSYSPKGYVFSQLSSDRKDINLCIADSGITIFQSFLKANLHQQEIAGNETTALWLANEGYSTKNRPEAENRGYGISTTRRMLVEGLGGAFFMLSGSAFYQCEKNSGNIFIDLKKLFRWNGTMIWLKIPVAVSQSFNYVDYLE